MSPLASKAIGPWIEPSLVAWIASRKLARVSGLLAAAVRLTASGITWTALYEVIAWLGGWGFISDLNLVTHASSFWEVTSSGEACEQNQPSTASLPDCFGQDRSYTPSDPALITRGMTSWACVASLAAACMTPPLYRPARFTS